MSESPAVRKAREDLEAVKAKLGGELKFGEAAALMAEYNQLCAFIYYRTCGRPAKTPGARQHQGRKLIQDVNEI